MCAAAGELLRGIRHLELAATGALEEDVVAGLEHQIADRFLVRSVHLAADEVGQRLDRVQRRRFVHGGWHFKVVRSKLFGLDRRRLLKLYSVGRVEPIPKRRGLQVVRVARRGSCRMARQGRNPADRRLGHRWLERGTRPVPIGSYLRPDRRLHCARRLLCARRLVRARGFGRRGDLGLTPGNLHPLELLPCFVVAAVDRQQGVEPPLRFVEPEQTLADIGQRLEGDHILAIEPQHVQKGRLGLPDVAQIHVAATQHDARRDVVRMVLETQIEQLERPLSLTILPVDFGERGESESLRVLGVPALELLDLAKCHPGPGLSDVWNGVGRRRFGSLRRVR